MRAVRYGYLYFLIFIFFFSSFMIFSNGRFGGDGLENYLTAESIVLDQDLSIYDRPFEVRQMRHESHGPAEAGSLRSALYTSYGIGMPIMLIPLYFIGHIISKVLQGVPHDYVTQFCVSLANPFIIALTAAALFSLLSRLGFSLKTSFLTVVCYGFGTMTLIYTRSGFSEPAIGLLVVLALIFLYDYEKTGEIKNIVIISALAGYALLIKNNSLLYFPLLSCFIVYKTILLKSASSRFRLWTAFCVTIAAFIFLYLYFRSIMGCGISDLPAATYNDIVARAKPEKFQVLKGLYYYIFSAGKGYFFFNIPLLLALFGTLGSLIKRREFSIYLIVIVMFNLLFYSIRFNRGSLFSWGPRYLYPTVPVMCIFLAEFIENATSLIKKGLVKICLIAGFFAQLPCLVINFSNYLFFVKEQLGLPEYTINFIPDLSPIRGAWYLFISAINRIWAGRSLYFIYNPDSLFVEPIKKSMENYDLLDVWWSHVVSISPGLFPAVCAALFILAASAITSFIRLRGMVKK